MKPLLYMSLTAALLAACSEDTTSGPPAGEHVSEAGDGAELKGDSFGTSTATPPGTTVRLQIEHGAFPVDGALPNVVAYIPKRFDPTAPVGVVVFLHGWYNCADNVIRPKNGTCVAGGAAHNAYNLANQLEASGRNALLIVPELMFVAASSEPGRLAEQDAFYELLDDAMTQLADDIGGLTLWDVSTIVVASHSGGYHAAAGIAAVGGLWVDELFLLDSLYGEAERFDAYLQDDVDAMSAAPPTRRFASVYSRDGGALKDNLAMADRAAAWLPTGVLLDDRTTATLATADYSHGALFKRTGLGHDDIPRYYFGRLVQTSSLPPIP